MSDVKAHEGGSPATLPMPGCDGSTEHFDLEFGGFRLEIDYYNPEAASRALCRKGQELRNAPDGSAFVFAVSTVETESRRLGLAAGL